jgi:hypothetical protein
VSSTFTIRIPAEIRKKMKKYPIGWSEEIRSFVEKRIKQLELAEKIENIEKKARKRTAKVDSTGLIREDRERRSSQ